MPARSLSKHEDSLHATTRRVLDVLKKSPMTIDEMTVAVGMSEATICNHRTKLKDLGLIHISGWQAGERNGLKAVYAPGNKPDKPKPVMKKTLAEITKRQVELQRIRIQQRREEEAKKLSHSEVIERLRQTGPTLLACLELAVKEN